VSDQLAAEVVQGERAGLALEYLGPKFDAVETDLFNLLADVNMHDQHTKDELLRTVKNLRRLRDLIHQDIAGGDLAREMIRRRMGERVRGALGW